MAMPVKPQRLAFSNMLTQFFPPTPAFTEKDIPDLSGKVYIVTGSNTGVGKEVAQILYSKNAKVYIFARSQERVSQAIASIKTAHPDSQGSLIFQHLDLSDLSTIKRSVQAFTARESRLDVLFNNAGVQCQDTTAAAKPTEQGHEVHLGVNVLGTFLLTKLLLPTLAATAARARQQPSGSGAGDDSVRVVWVSSMGAEMVGEPDRGLSLRYLDYWPNIEPLRRYGISKAGNWLHAVELARRARDQGVLVLPCNPGHLRSDLYRDSSLFLKTFINAIAYHPVYGAYTELFAGLAPEIGMEQSGDWIIPWGRFQPIREDLQAATKSKDEGGNGWAREFWDWSEEQVKEYT